MKTEPVFPKEGVRYSVIRTEEESRERCHIAEIWNQADDSVISIARCRVPAGVTTELHSLPIYERYLIEHGSGWMEVNGHRRQKVSSGDAIVIHPGSTQRIYNDGSEDLVFLAICTPSFQSQHYTPLE